MSDAKLLGGLGSILMILGLVHFVIGIIGLVLVLVAVKSISDRHGDEGIFKNAIMFVVFSMLGVVVIWISVLASLPALLFAHNLMAVMVHAFLGVVVAFVLFILSAVFFRKCFNRVAEVTGVTLFSTASLLYLIGAVTTVIVIGFAIILVSEVLLAVAFFSLPE